MKPQNLIIIVSFVCLFAAGLLVGSNSNGTGPRREHEEQRIFEDDLDRNARMYCSMVSLYLATNGEYGWPDYKKSFRQTCDM